MADDSDTDKKKEYTATQLNQESGTLGDAPANQNQEGTDESESEDELTEEEQAARQARIAQHLNWYSADRKPWEVEGETWTGDFDRYGNPTYDNPFAERNARLRGDSDGDGGGGAQDPFVDTYGPGDGGASGGDSIADAVLGGDVDRPGDGLRHFAIDATDSPALGSGTGDPIPESGGRRFEIFATDKPALGAKATTKTGDGSRAFATVVGSDGSKSWIHVPSYWVAYRRATARGAPVALAHPFAIEAAKLWRDANAPVISLVGTGANLFLPEDKKRTLPPTGIGILTDGFVSEGTRLFDGSAGRPDPASFIQPGQGLHRAPTMQDIAGPRRGDDLKDVPGELWHHYSSRPTRLLEVPTEVGLAIGTGAAAQYLPPLARGLGFLSGRAPFGFERTVLPAAPKDSIWSGFRVGGHGLFGKQDGHWVLGGPKTVPAAAYNPVGHKGGKNTLGGALQGPTGIRQAEALAKEGALPQAHVDRMKLSGEIAKLLDDSAIRSASPQGVRPILVKEGYDPTTVKAMLNALGGTKAEVHGGVWKQALIGPEGTAVAGRRAATGDTDVTPLRSMIDDLLRRDPSRVADARTLSGVDSLLTQGIQVTVKGKDPKIADLLRGAGFDLKGKAGGAWTATGKPTGDLGGRHLLVSGLGHGKANRTFTDVVDGTKYGEVSPLTAEGYGPKATHVFGIRMATGSKKAEVQPYSFDSGAGTFTVKPAGVTQKTSGPDAAGRYLAGIGAKDLTDGGATIRAVNPQRQALELLSQVQRVGRVTEKQAKDSGGLLKAGDLANFPSEGRHKDIWSFYDTGKWGVRELQDAGQYKKAATLDKLLVDYKKAYPEVFKTGKGGGFGSGAGTGAKDGLGTVTSYIQGPPAPSRAAGATGGAGVLLSGGSGPKGSDVLGVKVGTKVKLPKIDVGSKLAGGSKPSGFFKPVKSSPVAAPAKMSQIFSTPKAAAKLFGSVPAAPAKDTPSSPLVPGKQKPSSPMVPAESKPSTPWVPTGKTPSTPWTPRKKTPSTPWTPVDDPPSTPWVPKTPTDKPPARPPLLPPPWLTSGRKKSKRKGGSKDARFLGNTLDRDFRGFLLAPEIRPYTRKRSAKLKLKIGYGVGRKAPAGGLFFTKKAAPNPAFRSTRAGRGAAWGFGKAKGVDVFKVGKRPTKKQKKRAARDLFR